MPQATPPAVLIAAPRRWIRAGLPLVLVYALLFCLQAPGRGGAGEGNEPGAKATGDAAAEARHLSGLRRLTFAGAKNGEAYFSGDGSRIVFQGVRESALRNPFYQIYTMDLASGVTRRVSTGTGRTTCSFFHPKGNRLLFASSHLDPQVLETQAKELAAQRQGTSARYEWAFDPYLELFETDLDGAHPQRLTESAGYDAECAYSPDGKRIVFCSFRDGDGEIYVMDADGRNPLRLTRTKGYDGGPFFSPDGTRIVWRRFEPNEKQAEIWLMKADGSDQRALTRLGAMAWSPYFHPSGDWIVFASNHEDPAFELYAIRPDGSAPTRLTFSPGFDSLPVCAPNGRQLLWTSSRDGDGSHLYLADLRLPPPPEAGEPGPGLRLPGQAAQGIKPAQLAEQLRRIDPAQPAAEPGTSRADRLRAALRETLQGVAGGPGTPGQTGERGEWPPQFALLEDSEVTGLAAGGPPQPPALGLALLPSGMSWPAIQKGEQRCPLVVAAVCYSPDPGTEEAATGQAVWLELARQMAAVALFRGLKQGLVFVALPEGRLKGKGAEIEAAGLLLPEPRKSVSAVLAWGDLLAEGPEAVLEGAGAIQGLRLLAEQLAAANPALRLRLEDERIRAGQADGAQPTAARRSLLQEWTRRVGERGPWASLYLCAERAAPGRAGLAEPPAAGGAPTPLQLAALHRRADLLLGALYRLGTGALALERSADDELVAQTPKRIYLGTRPEYVGEKEGVTLKGVYPESPAEQAGLKPGDKVVGLGGQAIGDVESYLRAIEGLKAGEAAEVIVLRAGQRLILRITPQKR